MHDVYADSGNSRTGFTYYERLSEEAEQRIKEGSLPLQFGSYAHLRARQLTEE